MKRRAPLGRRTRLRSGGPIRARAPRRRGETPPPLKFGKDRRVLDPEWIAEVRRHPCRSCKRRPPSEAHHVIPRGMGGASQRDDMVVPMCRRDHMRCEGLVVSENGLQYAPIPKEQQLEWALEWAARRVEWQRAQEGDDVIS